MNEMQIFNNQEFGQIRTITENGKTLFCGKDVATALGYKRPADAITAHCKGAVIRRLHTNGGKQDVKFIPEGDIYRMAAKSELPGADKFESWIFDEVLPSIRATGGYNLPKDCPSALRALADTEEKRLALERQAEVNRPKVLFADSVTASKTSIIVGEMAKLLKQNGVDIGQNRLFAYLRKNGYLIRRKGTDYNMPTQRSMEMGLFEIKETSVVHADGHTSVSKTPKVTGKGQQYFVNLFLGKNI